ncbi:hypothetical protein LCGC14_1374270 [marine sediment metagenome]|uniref:Methyltransferase FkbM domain-containing protein n=1 Tax=marine sediment metagenome TaxID=412755 RepID=A0A0F9K4I4_9ZZZZ
MTVDNINAHVPWVCAEVVVKGTDIELKFPVDVAIGRELNRRGIWAPEMVQWLRNFVSSHEECGVLIIGAHIGEGTTVCARYSLDNAEVHSFEPHPELYKFLVHNTIKYPNVKTYNYAIGLTEGVQSLLCNTKNSGDNIIESIFSEYSASIDLTKERYSKISCEMRLLTSFDIDFSKIKLIKIDTQGMDRDIYLNIHNLFQPGTTMMFENTPLTAKFVREQSIKHELVDGDFVVSL